jgi:nitrogen fixation protein NifQ
MMAATFFPDDLYARLTTGPGGDEPDFDAHVVASILAMAAAEAAATGAPLIEGVGLDGERLRALAARLFPRADALFDGVAGDILADRPEEELCLDEILSRHGVVATGLEADLAAMIARRAQRPNHLWQDLGLRHRGELSRLMDRHFRQLAIDNVNDMKWKKFLYRAICADQGFSLCTAPSCSECADFNVCFGEEDGESLLARVRLSADTKGDAP